MTQSINYEPPKLDCPARYTVSGLLAETDRSTIFLARDQHGERDVAIKRFRSSDGEAYLREASLGFDFDHPNVLVCSDTFYSEHVACLVFDFAPDGTLADLLQSRDRFSSAQALDCVQQILRGLQHIHGLGRIHCDIKPENIFVVRDQSGNVQFKIGDLGASCYAVEASTNVYTPGTPAYRAPERIYDKFDATSDFYSLGVLAYELVVGSTPFVGSVEEMSRAHLAGNVDFSKIADLSYRELVVKLMARKPQRRFADAEQALHVCRTLLAYGGRDIVDNTLDVFDDTSIAFDLEAECLPRKFDFDVCTKGAVVTLSYDHHVDVVKCQDQIYTRTLPSFIDSHQLDDQVFYCCGTGVVAFSPYGSVKETLASQCKNAQSIDVAGSRVAWVDDYQVAVQQDGRNDDHRIQTYKSRGSYQRVFKRLVKLRATGGVLFTDGTVNESLSELDEHGVCCFRERLPDSILDVVLANDLDYFITLRTDSGNGYALWQRQPGSNSVRRDTPEPFSHWAIDNNRLFLLLVSGVLAEVVEQEFITIGKLDASPHLIAVSGNGAWIGTVSTHPNGKNMVRLTALEGMQMNISPTKNVFTRIVK